MPAELKVASRERTDASLASAVYAEAPATRSTRALRLLAYVHLRNIYGSTGAGRVARQLTEHLARRDDVDLRVLADRVDRARILPLVGGPWQSFRYETFAGGTSRQQARWFALNSPRAESYWPEADVVFCTGESYVPTRNARLVVTAHDAAYFEDGAHQKESAFWRQRLKWKLLFRRLAARVDMLHTVSQYSADRLLHFFPAFGSRIQVVPNAVTPHFFMPPTLAGLTHLQEQGLSDRQYVLIPGGLHFRKNAELILQVAPALLENFPELVLVIAGHNDATYTKAAMALGSGVQTTGFVDDETLHALYAGAAVVWFPSRYEGFGLPILEAMASGSPVVGSNASSVPEIAGGAALLAGVDSPADHFESISALLKDPNLRQRLIDLGHLRANLFTWQRSAALLKLHFDELL